ncbi:MAG: acyloxyacyl hydrolase [Pseudomonadota bacterium]
MRVFYCLAAAAAMSGTAFAGPVDELRLGVMAHNICVNDCDNANKEDGPNVNGEVVFASPDFLSFAFSPRPFLMASGNVAGNTSFAGGGFHWTFDFADKWAIEPGLGYVFHDGTLENPFPQGDPQGAAFAEENVLLGSRDLFRTSLALNRDVGDAWGVQLQYEHLSHGQIIGNGRNQGMDTLGVRVYWRLGGE